jgi:hypothetical protein
MHRLFTSYLGMTVALSGLLLARAAPGVGQTALTRPFITSSSPEPARVVSGAGILRERRVNVDPSALGGQRLRVDLFPDVSYTVVLERNESTYAGRGWVGSFEGIDLSFAMFVHVGDTVSGYMSSPLGEFRLRPDPTGAGYTIQQLEGPTRATPDDVVSPPTDPAPPSASGVPPRVGVRATAIDSVVDVMVAYTTRSKELAGGIARIAADIDLMAGSPTAPFEVPGLAECGWFTRLKSRSMLRTAATWISAA